MYEFEFWDNEAKETVIMFGYSFDDLERRNPDVDFTKLKFVYKEYID